MTATTQDRREPLRRIHDRAHGLAVLLAIMLGALAGVVMADEGAAIATGLLGVALTAMAVPAVRRRGRPRRRASDRAGRASDRAGV